jgi:putative metallohydrolase (TIGR04338 family)
MEPAHRCELVLGHEVAHVLAAARYGSHAHDPWFACTYLELVWSMMGPDAYLALQRSFQDAGIEHHHDSTIPAGRAPSN